MPDLFSLSIGIIGLYYGIRWLKKEGKIIYLILFTGLICISVLTKISSGIILGLLVPFVLDREVLTHKKVFMSFACVLALLPSFWWYFYWIDYLASIDGRDYLYMGQGLKESLGAIANRPKDFVLTFVYAVQFIAFSFFIVGLVRMFFKKLEKKLMIGIVTSSLLMILFLLKAGDTFMNLSYYVFPIIPVMSIVIAYGIGWIKKQYIQRILLIAILIECVLSQQHQLFSKNTDDQLISLEHILYEFSSENYSIIIAGNNNPKYLYYAHRKGWLGNKMNLMDAKLIDRLKSLKCELIIWNKSGIVQLSYPLVFEDENFEIYQITDKNK
jgi:uncharacterized membrane protein